MTTNTTMTVDCGPLGEVEWTVQYKICHGSVLVNWIKLGGERGHDITDLVTDDYIVSEVWPHCLDDHHEGIACAAESRAEEQREMRRAA